MQPARTAISLERDMFVGHTALCTVLLTRPVWPLTRGGGGGYTLSLSPSPSLSNHNLTHILTTTLMSTSKLR